MPKASHRLDVIVVSARVGSRPEDDAIEAFLAGLGEAGVITDDRRAGVAAGVLFAGGFATLRIEDRDEVGLYANQQGGFRVECPVSGAAIAREFGQAVWSWRGGGPRTMACLACGGTHPLEGVVTRPPARFARFALVFTDAGSADPTPDAWARFRRLLTEPTLVHRRVG